MTTTAWPQFYATIEAEYSNLYPIQGHLDRILATVAARTAGSPRPVKVLELGAGTCDHSVAFAKRYGQRWAPAGAPPTPAAAAMISAKPHMPAFAAPSSPAASATMAATLAPTLAAKVQWFPTDIAQSLPQHATAYAAARNGDPAAVSDLFENVLAQPQRLDTAVAAEWAALRGHITPSTDDVPTTARFDVAVTVNTLHWMPKASVAPLFRHLSSALNPGGVFAVYGAFNYDGKFTSESNARFQRWLESLKDKATGESQGSGIRDIEFVVACAAEAGMDLVEDNEVPENNRMLLFAKRP